jgi:hypothetical protein
MPYDVIIIGGGPSYPSRRTRPDDLLLAAR